MGLTRREALAGVGGALAAGAAAQIASGAERGAGPVVRAFGDGRQAGIVTPRQDHLTLAAFDGHTPDRDDLRRLLADWTELVVALCADAARDPEDTGEAEGLGTCGLTVTVGFGASLFDDRYRPPAATASLSANHRVESGTPAPQRGRAAHRLEAAI